MYVDKAVEVGIFGVRSRIVVGKGYELVVEDEIRDLIIVGGGPSGLSAGLYAMRAALKTVLVEKGLPGGQVAITKGVENYPGIEDITGLELSEKLLKHARSYGLEILEQEVVAVEPGKEIHGVKLANGATLKAHAVILAVGGNNRKLDVPGEAEYFGRGVSYCATCDGFFFKDQVVMVVGGGDTAVEDALYLSRLARKVYLVHRSDTFRASRILQDRARAEPGIEFIVNTVVTEIQGNGQDVTGVSLRNLRTGEEGAMKTDGIFIFIGYAPNNRLVPEGVKLNGRGYVLTDEKCSTAIPGIFVSGDLRAKFANQIVIAAADGCTAALAAAQYVDLKKFGLDRKHANEGCDTSGECLGGL